MKRQNLVLAALVLIALAGPAAAVPPGIANTPTVPPPISSSPPTSPPIAITNSPSPAIVAVPYFPGTPGAVVAYPPSPPPVPPSPEIVRSPQPRQVAQNLVTPADYPPAAIAMRAEGRVGFVLMIGANGRAQDCLITRSSNYAVLDSATCRIMRSRGRFTPAIDSTGNPAAATVQQEVVWKLP